jgi:hypothetical protein
LLWLILILLLVLVALASGAIGLKAADYYFGSFRCPKCGHRTTDEQDPFLFDEMICAKCGCGCGKHR